VLCSEFRKIRTSFAMKTLIIILLAAGVSFASTYLVVSNQKAAQLKAAQAQWNVEKAQLEAAAAATGSPAAPAPTIVMTTPQSAPAEESPQDILNDLLNIKLGSGSGRNTALRMVVFKLESLAQRGKASVPAIRAFIGRNVDVEYGEQSNASNNQADAGGSTNQTNQTSQTNQLNNNNGFGGGLGGGGRGGRGGRFRRIQNLQTDWVVPPSLRLGLVGTLKEIGGSDGEQALAEILSTTARGVEIAYLARVLEEIAPGKYRDAAIAAAKELLMNPPAIDNPNQLDDLSRSYLFGVLEFFHDTSFAMNAQQMLVGKDGRLDTDAMSYLTGVLKDQSVSALYSAYENPNLTNQFDKMSVGREVLNYVGQNSQANALFTETLNNPDLNSRLKAATVAQLAGGGFGPFNSQSPTDPQVINSRVNILTQLLSQPAYANDETMSQVITATISALQSGTPLDMRQLFRGRVGGGFGGGGGGGGGNGAATGQ
jgi:hypothetical protein